MNLMEALISAKLGGGGGGGTVTPGTLVIVSGEMTDEQAAQFRENIGAITAADIGTVFTIKGSVATVADLPATGNSVGDVYYVEAVSAGFIWITSTEHPTGYWEELGEPIDLSAYELKPTVVNGAGQSQTITPADNTIYECGVVTSLTINAPADGANAIVRFIADQADVTVTVANTIEGLDGMTGEAGNIYEISFHGVYALFASWPYTPPISV